MQNNYGKLRSITIAGSILFGMPTANPKNNQPITRDTRFRAASVSRQFLVFTRMQLAEQKKLQLDDDVSPYLVGFNLRNSAHPDTILSYGLGIYQIDGTQSARVCKDKVVNLVGHAGEAFGLLSGLFFRPGTKDGFIYMTNGEAVAEDDDPRSAGQIGSNYSWEENIMNALCQAMTEGEK